jgi:hypothetical protein
LFELPSKSSLLLQRLSKSSSTYGILSCCTQEKEELSLFKTAFFLHKSLKFDVFGPSFHAIHHNSEIPPTLASKYVGGIDGGMRH